MKDQTVYISTPISELPNKNGYYIVSDPNGLRGPELVSARFYYYNNSWWLDDDCIHPTHWLKPVPLSTLVEEKVKELKQGNEYLSMLVNDMLADKKDNWVSVEERLPDYNTKVLCYYFPTHPVMEGQLIGVNYRREYDHLRGDIRNRLQDNSGFSENVTHWQPLPSPPKIS